MGENYKMYTIVADENDNLYVCGVTTDNHFLTDSYHTFILKSTDYGDTWNYIIRKDFELFDDVSYDNRYQFLHLFTKGMDTVYAFCDGGIIYKSYNGGENWDSTRITYNDKNDSLININNQAYCRSADTYNFNTWSAHYIDSPYQHFLYSTDQGETWIPQNTYEDNPYFELKRFQVAYYKNVSENSFYFTTKEREVHNTHLFKYDILQDTTYYINQIPENFNIFLTFISEDEGYIHNFYYTNQEKYEANASIFKTTDGGKSFSKFLDDNEDYTIIRMNFINNKIFAGGGSTCIYSDDEGATWKKINIEDMFLMEDMEVTSNEIVFMTDYRNNIFRISNITSVNDNDYNSSNNNQIAKSSLFLNFNAKDNYSYQIYDLRGKEKHSGSILVNSDFLTFDVSYLQNGTYIIVFKDSKGQVSDNVVFIKE
jgi:hypothetical protein